MEGELETLDMISCWTDFAKYWVSHRGIAVQVEDEDTRQKYAIFLTKTDAQIFIAGLEGI